MLLSMAGTLSMFMGMESLSICSANSVFMGISLGEENVIA